MITELDELMCSSYNKIVDISNSSPSPPCSGRGDCLNGTCLCEIRYSGDVCSKWNIQYHAGLSSIFYFVAALSLTQLLICTIAEYRRKQTLVRITTQKLLYFVIFVAAMLRGASYSKPEVLSSDWASFLVSAYYPLLLTCSSLIVCLWAEIFHLRNVRASQGTLTKSFLGFLAFNILPYSLFGAEILSSQVSKNRNLTAFFKGSYAVLLLIVLIFFLIYGVEVFFRIRGQFLHDDFTVPKKVCTISPQKTQPETLNTTSQVNHARFGLLSQAVMMTIIVVFLASETFGELWKDKVPVYSRNWMDIIFRVFEVGFALWFPCCLWNSISPEHLWILNPRTLLQNKRNDSFSSISNKTDTNTLTGEEVEEEEVQEESFLVTKKDCWICYDPDKNDPLIQPCNCKGDVSSVHHECLRLWLSQSFRKSVQPMRCKICNARYNIEKTRRLHWKKGFTTDHCAKTIILFLLLLITVLFAIFIIQAYTDPVIRVCTAGIAILFGYICIKLMGENTLIAIHRAKINSISIISK